jgi:galactokinase
MIGQRHASASSAQSDPNSANLLTRRSLMFLSSSLSAAIAPGRVNFIGEHTDYNDGFVMPLAIDRHTVLIGRRNGLQKWRLVTGNANAASSSAHASGAAAASASGAAPMDESGSATAAPAASASPVVELDNATMYAKYSGQVWHNYFRGVVAQFAAAGHAVPYFDVAIKGNVPLGGGLSSSASLEVATASFLQALMQLPLDATQRALWCQKCEHDVSRALYVDRALSELSHSNAHFLQCVFSRFSTATARAE